MPQKKSGKKSLIESPVKLGYEVTKTQERKILEFDPNRVKAGECVIVKVGKFGGLTNTCFAVLNKDGEEIIVKHLKEEKSETQ